jgi:hypothetical protein
VVRRRTESGSPLAPRAGTTGSDSPDACLADASGRLRTLARQIDGLSKTTDMDVAQFIQLDMAASNAFAAADAISAPDGVSDPADGLGPQLAMKRIFAAGLNLVALQALLGDCALSHEVSGIVDQLDALIRDFRDGVVE